MVLSSLHTMMQAIRPHNLWTTTRDSPQTYRLTASITVDIDDRGEAVLAFSADEAASGHCYVPWTADELDAAPDEEVFVDAADPAAFCVP